MKKNIKLSLVLAGCALLNHQAFSDTSINALSPSAGLSGGNSVITAINQLQQTIVSLFNSTFNGTFDSAGALTGLSTLDTKVNMYTKNYYSLYSTTDFTNWGGFFTKNKTTDTSVEKWLSQELGYNTQKDQAKKSIDTNTLLAAPIENDNNNINPTSLGLSTSANSSATPYGSIDDSAPTADSMPNFNDLIGKDSYANTNDQNQAKLFISYLLKSIPAPKTFYIPSKSEAINGKVAIYIPLPNEDNTAPYTTLSGGVSTKSDNITSATSGASEYDRMVAYLNGNQQYYQKYKMKTRAALIARTLYLENLFRIYQERAKNLNDKNDKSLAEKEKEMAFAALDKEYYAKLKTMSAADVNMEMIHALNKQNYFLYKLHKDNERIALMTEITALQLSSSDAMDEPTVRSIGTLIQNRCWNVSTSSSQSLQSTCFPVNVSNTVSTQ